MSRTGRNDPCPCGSGKKFKACCAGRAAPVAAPTPTPISLQAALGLHRAGRLDEAERAYRQLLASRPDHGDALHLLGVIAYQRGDPAAAVESYQAALRTNPDEPFCQSNLAQALLDLDRPSDAVAAGQAAAALKPDHAPAHNNLGNALRALGRTTEAIDVLQQAIRLVPDYPEAHNNLGNAFKDLGRIGDAIAHYRRALDLRPEFNEAHSNLLLALCLDSAISTAEYLDEARRYGTRVSRAVMPLPRRARAPVDDARPLRVGLVSGDLKAHPVGYFLASVVEQIDPRRLELRAYPTQAFEDSLSRRLRPRFAAWRCIAGLDDAQAAALIHADDNDLLIDLAGHTAHNRLPVFAYRPAPVQASWLGYFASSGLPAIDFYIADLASVPEGTDDEFCESVWRLPETRLCFTAPSAAPLPSGSPMLKTGAPTFGCFQQLAKLNDAVLAVWGRLMTMLPQARLRLQTRELNDEVTRRQMLARLTGHGIAAERVDLCPAVARDAYFASYANVDIALDTFPYPGGTTTCEALWMGVPTLTLAGRTLLGRQGAAIMGCVGLPHWIVDGTDAYVARAVELIADPDGLAALRGSLRQRAAASPLFDAPRFARHFEAALRAMWEARQN